MQVVRIDYLKPEVAFAAVAKGDGCALLDGAQESPSQRFSYIAAEPSPVVTATRLGIFVDGQERNGDPFSVLKGALNARRVPFASEAPAPFTGGIVGYFGYELANVLERLPPPKRDPLDMPLMFAGIYDTVVAFDHHRRAAWVISHASDGGEKARRMAAAIGAASPLPPPDWSRTGTWRPEQGRAAVENSIRRIVDYIRAGDIFQANFTQRFLARRSVGLGDYDIYRRLRALSPSPYAAFLRCGPVSLASASPERFLSLDAQRRILAQPIKGTRPRAADPALDARLADELRRSVKDNAENLMIVDLMRSDIGRVAETGSVRVPRLCEPVTFASVHHLVSSVEGRLREGCDAFDLLRATFPGGSVTGAPKIRAMEIIHELEPAPRGAYCGCLGWIGFDGAMDMSMTIRTLTLTRDTLVAQAGGGIVADSDPAAEYEESMTKIAPLLKTVAGDGTARDDGRDMAQRRPA